MNLLGILLYVSGICQRDHCGKFADFCYINHHVRFIKRNCNHLISIYKNIQLTLVFNLPRKLTVILKIIYQLKQQLIQL